MKRQTKMPRLKKAKNHGNEGVSNILTLYFFTNLSRFAVFSEREDYSVGPSRTDGNSAIILFCRCFGRLLAVLPIWIDAFSGRLNG